MLNTIYLHMGSLHLLVKTLLKTRTRRRRRPMAAQGFYSATYPHLGHASPHSTQVLYAEPCAQTSNSLANIVSNAERRFVSTFERLPDLGATVRDSKVVRPAFVTTSDKLAPAMPIWYWTVHDDIALALGGHR